MKFENIPNKLIQGIDGNMYWISRACAVVGVIFGIHKGNIYVLTQKRSSNMEEPNKWCAISGYLDFNETAYEAIIRETYEETSFNIPLNHTNLIFDNGQEPFFVQADHKKDARQNVSLTYVFIYNFMKLPINIEKFKNKEITEVKWMNIEEIFDEKYVWAFEHNSRIQMALDKYKHYFVL